jgi:hypothetical protein
MTRLELLERLLDLVDEASALIGRLPDDDRLGKHLRELEGNSNGGFVYGRDFADDTYFLRGHVELRILKEKGELPADLDPETI